MINVQENLGTKIAKSLSLLKEELATVRAGKANAALVDRVMVDYYGTATPLKSLANISVPESENTDDRPLRSQIHSGDRKGDQYC